MTQLAGEIFDADLLTPDAAGELELTGWMRIDCPTAERTAQISTGPTMSATVRKGLGANAARAISRDGVAFALLLEPAAVNLINDQNLSNYTPTGTPVLSSTTTPAGTTETVEVEDDDVAATERVTQTVATHVGSVLHTLSAWTWLVAISAGTASLIIDPGPDKPRINITVPDTGWVFRSNTQVTDAGIGAPDFTVQPVNIPAETATLRAWGMQSEQRAYPTSFQGADNATFTRAADVCRAVPDVIAPGGRYQMVLRYRPHYSESEQTVDHNLIYFDDSNRLFLRPTDSKFVLLVDGAELASAAVTFSRFQTLTITIEHSETRRRLLVAGATTGNGDTVGAATAAITLPLGWAFLLGGPSGSEEGAELVGLDFHDLSSITLQQLADVRVLVQMDDATANRKFRELMIDFADGASRFRDVCFAVRIAFDLDSAAGDQLDKIGFVVGLSREGFTDARYRVFLEIQILLLISASRDDANWTGTVQNIVTICRKFIGTTVDSVILTNSPPYSYTIQVPGLVLSEAFLLARFFTTANYAAVLGLMIVIISSDSLWESNVAPITDGGVWESNVVPIAGASDWQIVVVTT